MRRPRCGLGSFVCIFNGLKPVATRLAEATPLKEYLPGIATRYYGIS